MHKFLKIFSLGSENHNQKTSKSGGFSPENHCRAPPRGGVFYSSFCTHKGCQILKKFSIFCSECINFCRFFDCEVKITARKPANLMDFFMKIISFGEECQSVKWKAKKLTRFSKNIHFFSKFINFWSFFCSCRIANGFLRPGASGRCKSQPENQQILWVFSSKSLTLTRNPIR